MPPSKFNINILKGRMAENLVQDLFINSGYNIFNYGLERTHPGLSKTLRNNSQKTSKAFSPRRVSRLEDPVEDRAQISSAQGRAEPQTPRGHQMQTGFEGLRDGQD